VPEIGAREMCSEMIAADLAEARRHALLKRHGYNVSLPQEH